MTVEDVSAVLLIAAMSMTEETIRIICENASQCPDYYEKKINRLIRDVGGTEKVFVPGSTEWKKLQEFPT